MSCRLDCNGMENKFAGNLRIVEYFRKIIADKNLASTYLFSGPEGVGKKYFATLLARSILCQNNNYFGCTECRSCYKTGKNIHPDLWIYEPENSVITIDQIRILIQRLALRPSESEYSVHIIDAVETMRIEAANAFLKITEEPPSFALIILVTMVPDLLPATVRSRCVRIKFNRIPYNDLYHHLLQLNIPEQKAALMAHWADGSISRAITMDYDHYRTLRSIAFQILINMTKLPQSKNFPESLPPAFKRDKASLEKAKEDFKQIAHFILDLLEECIAIKSKSGSIRNHDIIEELKPIAQSHDMDTLYSYARLVEEAKQEFTVFHQNPLLLFQKLIAATI
jgi:DNA polymerase III subunit delta'